MQKKLKVAVLGVFTMIMSFFLISGIYDEIYVRKNGQIVNAAIVDITSTKPTSYTFRYNTTRFSNRNNSKYYNMKDSKVGDTLIFYHLSDKPYVFVPTERTWTDINIDLSISFFFLVVGLYLLIYQFVILPKKNIKRL